MIIYMSIGLVFALSVLTVYSLIQLGKNNILTFFLIPLALIASIFTGYTIFALQGTPIDDMVKTAKRLAKDGFATMPHFPARIIKDIATLNEWIYVYRYPC